MLNKQTMLRILIATVCLQNPPAHAGGIKTFGGLALVGAGIAGTYMCHRKAEELKANGTVNKQNKIKYILYRVGEGAGVLLALGGGIVTCKGIAGWSSGVKDASPRGVVPNNTNNNNTNNNIDSQINDSSNAPDAPEVTPEQALINALKKKLECENLESNIDETTVFSILTCAGAPVADVDFGKDNNWFVVDRNGELLVGFWRQKERTNRKFFIPFVEHLKNVCTNNIGLKNSDIDVDVPSGWNFLNNNNNIEGAKEAYNKRDTSNMIAWNENTMGAASFDWDKFIVAFGQLFPRND